MRYAYSDLENKKTVDDYIYKNKFALSLAIVGFILGLYFAYKKGSKWYGYIGYAILFDIAGQLIGTAIDYQRMKKPE